MKMNVEIRPPKIFGRRNKEEDKGQMEVSVNDTKVSETALLVGGALVFGLTVGYLVGFNRGVNKNSTMYIIQ